MNKRKLHVSLRFISILVRLGCCLPIAGCTRAPSALDTALPSQEIRLHTVSFPHENLSIIALWYTGDTKNWSLLKSYNGHLPSGRFLSSGDIVRIPAELMQRSDKLSPEFVAEQRSKAKRLRKRAPTAGSPKKSPAIVDAKVDALPTVNKITEREEEDPSIDEFSEGASQDHLIENLLSE